MQEDLVRDWMSTDLVTVTPDTTLPEAHQLMIDEEIRRLPVVEMPQDGDGPGRLVGIITLGDVRGAEPSAIRSIGIWEMNYLLSRATVDKFMTRNLVTITPNETIANAALMMLANRISTLPVVEGHGRLVGILTESDIFAMLVVDKWGYKPAVLSRQQNHPAP